MVQKAKGEEEKERRGVKLENKRRSKGRGTREEMRRRREEERAEGRRVTEEKQ